MLDSISVLIDALSKAISSKLLSYVDRRELLDHHLEMDEWMKYKTYMSYHESVGKGWQ